ncbi:unnamed protein product [Ixodes persulcatus]
MLLAGVVLVPKHLTDKKYSMYKLYLADGRKSQSSSAREHWLLLRCPTRAITCRANVCVALAGRPLLVLTPPRAETYRDMAAARCPTCNRAYTRTTFSGSFQCRVRVQSFDRHQFGRPADRQ